MMTNIWAKIEEKAGSRYESPFLWHLKAALVELFGFTGYEKGKK